MLMLSLARINELHRLSTRLLNLVMVVVSSLTLVVHGINAARVIGFDSRWGNPF